MAFTFYTWIDAVLHDAPLQVSPVLIVMARRATADALVWQGQSVTAKALNVPLSTVSRAIKWAKANNVIVKRGRRVNPKTGRPTKTTEWRLIPPDEWATRRVTSDVSGRVTSDVSVTSVSIIGLNHMTKPEESSSMSAERDNFISNGGKVPPIAAASNEQPTIYRITMKADRPRLDAVTYYQHCTEWKAHNARQQLWPAGWNQWLLQFLPYISAEQHAQWMSRLAGCTNVPNKQWNTLAVRGIMRGETGPPKPAPEQPRTYSQPQKKSAFQRLYDGDEPEPEPVHEHPVADDGGGWW